MRITFEFIIYPKDFQITVPVLAFLLLFSSATYCGSGKSLGTKQFINHQQ